MNTFIGISLPSHQTPKWGKKKEDHAVVVNESREGKSYFRSGLPFNNFYIYKKKVVRDNI